MQSIADPSAAFAVVRPTVVPQADERALGAWREWLGMLTKNAEAAIAAALAYEQLDEPDRDSWIEALGDDADQAKVPRFAVFAPLLAVELDRERRQRIENAIGVNPRGLTPRHAPRALTASLPGDTQLAVVVRPLYLDFVQVLACAYRADVGIEWVKHDPIVRFDLAPKAGERLAGAELECTPLKAVIDRLAQAVVAHSKRQCPLPDSLRPLADLFGLTE